MLRSCRESTKYGWHRVIACRHTVQRIMHGWSARMPLTPRMLRAGKHKCVCVVCWAGRPDSLVCRAEQVVRVVAQVVGCLLCTALHVYIVWGLCFV